MSGKTIKVAAAAISATPATVVRLANVSASHRLASLAADNGSFSGVRALLPIVVWRMLFPMPAMPWVGIRLAECESGATRYARGEDCEPAPRHVGGHHKGNWEFPPKPSRMRWKTKTCGV
jgi:hypothetical protein